jgi:iron complex outermembrane recepter protein
MSLLPKKSTVLSASIYCVLATAASTNVLAAETSGEQKNRLDVVTVTATRVAANSYDVPASISSVSGESLRAGLGVNLSDNIAEVPGLLARNRNNYAQDQQVSIRGFGASSPFGIRGVRIYQDGIPQSSPDGQGQVSQFNLDSASRVEILRGPFSALYGNSAGGVIQLFTADGTGPIQFRDGAAYGSFDTLRLSAGVSGAAGPVGYNAAFTHFAVDGYRDHSSARSESFNSKLNYAINDANRLTLVLNFISRPDTDDALGLTAASFNADPDQTDIAAINFNTRKSFQQGQAGLSYDLQLNAGQSLRFMSYFGTRSVEQFLSIPPGPQNAAVTHSGGVVDLDRRYGGADARWSWEGSLADKPFSLVAGVSYDKQNEQRRGFANFVGATNGVKGALRRDEDNIASNFDQYAQGRWEFAEQWSAMLGVRHTQVRFESDDRYIVGANLDDSDSTTYGSTSPVAGLLYKTQPWLHLYASYGKGFQTPIGTEVAYRADGASGFNNLNAAQSNNAEFGAKLRFGSNLSIEAAVFQARTNDDIVLNTNSGGRSTYRNADTQRQGAELSVDYRPLDSLRLQLAYTYVDATYDGGFLTCSGAPCPVATVPVADGRSLPGVPLKNIYAGIRWGQDTGWNASFNAQALSRVPVSDTNATQAPGYATADIAGGYVAEFSMMNLSAFVRVNNISDKRYVGSVIVGDGNGRFFEPAPGRNVLAGINVTWK